jgi:hypothetical protein
MPKKKPKSVDPAEDFIGEMDEVLDYKRDTDKNIYQRIHSVMMEVWYIQKEKGDYYNTVKHDDVTKKIRPSLIRHGVVAIPVKIETVDPIIVDKEKYDYKNDRSYIQKEFFTEAKVYVKFINIDNPDDFIVVPGYGHGIDAAGNAPGKAVSYAVKYVFLKALNLETGDEEDQYDSNIELDSDPNAVAVYNSIGKDLFGDEWEKKGAKKIYSVTKGKTSDPSRAPLKELNSAIRNLYELKKKRDENPEADIKSIEKEQEKDTMNDILKEFKDED